MSKTTFAGHPLHPQTVMMPIALFPFSFVMDVMHAVTGKKSYAESAYLSMIGGYIGGLGAAMAGLPDYAAIPTKDPAKTTANAHIMINVATMSAYSVNLILRSRNRSPGLLGSVLSGLGAAGIIAAQWYGGHLVYDHGMRVKKVSPIEKVRESKLPGDERIAKAFQKAGASA